MKIKTFPLKFIEKDLTEISNKAKSLNMSTYKFIMEAIKEKLERE